MNSEHISHILDDMADVVKKSYGPIGASTLMIQKSGDNGAVLASITKDGYTLLSKTKYFHPVAQALKQLVLSSMLGVLSTAGDGTTTTTILIADLYKSLAELRDESNLPAQFFNDLIKDVVEYFKKEMDDEKVFAEADLSDLIGIIETSVNNDTELKDALIGALKDITRDGEDLSNISITYKADGTQAKTSYSVKEGYTIQQGPLGFPKAVLRKKIIPVIVDNNIASADSIRNLMKLYAKVAYNMIEFMNSSGMGIESIAPVVFITYNLQYKDVVEREILQVRNWYKTKYNVDFLPIYILEYAYTGTILSQEEHKDFEYLIGQPQAYELDKKLRDIFPDNIEEFTEEELDFTVSSYVENLLKVGAIYPVDAILTKTQVTLFGFDKVRAEGHVKELQDELELVKDDKGRADAIKARIRRINGKYAEIVVGADNSWEVDRKLGAVDDAVGAIKSAVASGVCGGMSTIIAKTYLEVDLKYKMTGNPMDKIKRTIANRIYMAYLHLVYILFESVGFNLTEAIYEATNHVSAQLNDYFSMMEDKDPKLIIRESFDLRVLLDKMYKGEECTLNDITTFKVLNSIDAEKKILDAATGAVIALLGTNQITMPDQYDVESFKNGQL